LPSRKGKVWPLPSRW